MSKKIVIAGGGKATLTAAVSSVFTENSEDVKVVSPDETKQIVLEYSNPYIGIENKITESTPKSGQQLRRERRAALRAKNKKRP